MATNDELMKTREADLICETMQDVESRSIPIMLLQAVHENTRITEQTHGTMTEAKNQLDEVRADTKIVKADVASVKLEQSNLHLRVTNLEAWRALWGRVSVLVFGIILTGAVGYLFSFLPVHHH